jgi:protein-disulfide isomerase
MKRRQIFRRATVHVALWCLLAAASFSDGQTANKPEATAQKPGAGGIAIDKAHLASYIHYAEGFTEAVTVTVDDPTPSRYRDFYRVVVHVVAGSSNLGDKVYYATPDGKRIVNGNLWDLDRSPFFEILSAIPSNLPSFGPADAPISIVVFSDFQCPYCRSLAQTIRQNVPKSFPKDVRVQFADFPLEPKHPWARAAAEASHCIGDNNNDAFWSFHDWIFANQGDIDAEGKNLRDKLLGFAKQQNLDTAKLTACLDSRSTAQEVVSNQKIASLLGVQQTPTFFVNGRKVEGAVPWSNIEGLIQYELKRPGDISLGTKSGGG